MSSYQLQCHAIKPKMAKNAPQIPCMYDSVIFRCRLLAIFFYVGLILNISTFKAKSVYFSAGHNLQSTYPFRLSHLLHLIIFQRPVTMCSVMVSVQAMTKGCTLILQRKNMHKWRRFQPVVIDNVNSLILCVIPYIHFFLTNLVTMTTGGLSISSCGWIILHAS